MRSNISILNTSNSWHLIETANENSMIQANIPSMNTEESIKVIHWNCNSIKNKINEFLIFIQLNKPDLISLNETKCCETWANELLCISGYNSAYKCRNINGGGVAILIKDKYEFDEITMELFNEEIIGITSKFNNKTIGFFSHYNPPNRELNIELFEYIQNNFENYFIMGDLNAKS